MKAEKTASYELSINSFEASHFPLLSMSLGPLASFQIKSLKILLSPLTPRWRGLAGVVTMARVLSGTSKPEPQPHSWPRQTWTLACWEVDFLRQA